MYALFVGQNVARYSRADLGRLFAPDTLERLMAGETINVGGIGPMPVRLKPAAADARQWLDAADYLTGEDADLVRRLANEWLAVAA